MDSQNPRNPHQNTEPENSNSAQSQQIATLQPQKPATVAFATDNLTKASKKSLLLIIMVVLVLIVGGVGAFVLLKKDDVALNNTSKGTSASTGSSFSFDRSNLEKKENITGALPTVETYVTGSGVDSWRLNVYEMSPSTIEREGINLSDEFAASYVNYYYDQELISQGTKGDSCGQGRDENFNVPNSSQPGYRYSVCYRPTQYDLLSAVTSRGTVVTLYVSYYKNSQKVPKVVETIFQSFRVN